MASLIHNAGLSCIARPQSAPNARQAVRMNSARASSPNSCMRALPRTALPKRSPRAQRIVSSRSNGGEARKYLMVQSQPLDFPLANGEARIKVSCGGCDSSVCARAADRFFVFWLLAGSDSSHQPTPARQTTQCMHPLAGDPFTHARHPMRPGHRCGWGWRQRPQQDD